MDSDRGAIIDARMRVAEDVRRLRHRLDFVGRAEEALTHTRDAVTGRAKRAGLGVVRAVAGVASALMHKAAP